MHLFSTFLICLYGKYIQQSQNQYMTGSNIHKLHHLCFISVVALFQVALAVSLNLRTYLRLKATTTGKVCINLPNIETFFSWDLSDLKQLIPHSCGKKLCSNGCCKHLFTNTTHLHCNFYCYIVYPIEETVLC